MAELISKDAGRFLLAFANLASVEDNIPAVFGSLDFDGAEAALGPFHVSLLFHDHCNHFPQLLRQQPPECESASA
jgi:hypothetical protein